MTRTILFLFFIVVSCSQFRKHEDPAIPGSLEEAVESSARAEENTERDEFQHPKATLEYFGIKPAMTVVEISPGAGYYTEILAPYLAREGQYVMAIPRIPQNPPPFLIENEKKLQDILLRQQEVKAKTKFIPFEPLDKRNRIKKDYVDLVLVFGHVHNWIAKNETAVSLKFCHDILKKGGTLGIVQHRIKAGKKRVPKSGYMYEKEVINLVTKAGFKLVGKSEINANPRDTADYPEGVWVLPPTYRLGEEDRDKYEDIGESDRMTLKFVKI
jgi:predicted methyltransferase